MEIIRTPLDLEETSYQLKNIDEMNHLLFFDIETTGFSAKTSNLYLIGLLSFEENKPIITQLFANTSEDEKDVLEEFIRICKNYKTLIHFNGNTFDIPYIKEKCKQHQLSHPFDVLNGVDIYKRFSTFKEILHLENCKQKTVEQFAGIQRDDQYNGKELIDLYKRYTTNPTEDLCHLLLLHNFDDIKGMYQILPVLSYMDLLLVPFRVVKVQANIYYDLNEKEQTEIVMKMRFQSPFPQPISMNKFGCRFSGEGTEGYLKVPLKKEPLRYFYSNYKDYYYLSKEDTALHKSVAAFVDRDYREQATARNCYTWKDGSFLPEWDMIFTPVFKTDYEDPVLYFELTNEMKKEPEEFRKYALHLIDVLIHAKEN